MASFQVQSALRQLGRDIQTARKKRRLSVADFCQRIGVTDKTLTKLERGDGGVRLETFAAALLALGELGRLTDLLESSKDETGLGLDQARLPQRITARRKSAKATTPEGQLRHLDDDEGSAF